MFSLAVSYMKKSDTWKISFMDPPHNCTTTNLLQDHHKLRSQLICLDIFPLVGKNPPLNVSTIISHIVTRFNHTPSYKKAWIARNKIVEQVYWNWEKSYNKIPQYLVALQQYVSGMVAIMKTLPTYTQGGTYVRSRIFHQLFWIFQSCIKGFWFYNIIQIDGT